MGEGERGVGVGGGGGGTLASDVERMDDREACVFF